MKKIGFTLLELIIVVGIVAVLMTLTLRFGSNRFRELQDSSVHQQLLDMLTTAVHQSLITNYVSGQVYDHMQLHLAVGAPSLTTSYFASNILLFPETTSFPESASLSGILLDGQEVNESRIDLLPYIVGCTLSDVGSGGILQLRFAVRDIPFCLRMNSQNCRFIIESCPE